MGISALLASQILDASATGRSVLTGADASAIRSTLGLGTLATQSPTGTPSASTFLRGDFSWQTIDLSGYVPYTGATGAVNLGSNSLTAGAGTFSDHVTIAENKQLKVGASGLQTFLAFGGGYHSWSTSGSERYGWYSDRFSLANNSAIGFSSIGIGAEDLFIRRDASDTLAQRRSTNPQIFRLYGTYTDASNYRRLFLSSTTAGAFTLGVEGAGTGASGNELKLLGTDVSSGILIGQSGNVVIGSTSPGSLYRLDVRSSSETWVRSSTTSSSRYSAYSLGTNNNAHKLTLYAFSSNYGGSSQYNANASLIEANGDLYYTAGSHRFYSGNVGIGQTSPAAKLDISDTTGAGSGSLQASAINIAQTWNTTGTPTAFKLNVTDTASNAASLLMDLQVGGTSKARVKKTGTIRVTNGVVLSAGGMGSGGVSLELGFDNYGIGYDGNGSPVVVSLGVQHQTLGLNTIVGSGGSYGWSTSSEANINAVFDLALYRDAADTLAQRRSTNAQTFRLYNTFTNSSNYERAKLAWESNILRIGTEKAGTGSARALELQTDGTTRLTIGTTGSFTIADALDIAIGTTTGTKIGTATTQLLGFYGATPVDQPATVSDATTQDLTGSDTVDRVKVEADLTSCKTAINAIIDRLQELGLIA